MRIAFKNGKINYLFVYGEHAQRLQDFNQTSEDATIKSCTTAKLRGRAAKLRKAHAIRNREAEKAI